MLYKYYVDSQQILATKITVYYKLLTIQHNLYKQFIHTFL